MKSVLVLNHFAVPRGHPGGTRHVELFGRLQGWRYLIIASDLNPLTGVQQSPEPGFHPVRTMSYRGNGWRRVLNWMSYAAMAFALGVRQRRIDVVYASSPHLLAPLAGWAIATLRRAPLVLEVRDLWPRVLLDMGQLNKESPIYRVLVALERFLYSKAGRIVVMAEGVRVDLLSHGVPDEKIVYIPNGADPEDFRPSDARAALRKRYGFQKFTAIYAGAHGPANGLQLLLDAASEITAMPMEIVLVGDGVLKSDLQRSASGLRLANVRFLDAVPKEEMPDLLHAADLGLHVLADVALFQDAISPNKVFDYMAAGLPVLTNCPGLVADLVTRARCGFAVDPEELGAGLKAVFESEDLAARGDSGRAWVAINQSRTAMTKRLEQVLTGELIND